MGFVRRLYNILRSRRLAMWLIGIVVVYSAIGTSVPQRSEQVDFAAWSAAHPVLAPVLNVLGLTNAWASPLFLFVVVLFIMSTAACSWERTDFALRELAREREGVPVRTERLRRGGKLQVPVERPEHAVERISAAFESVGLRVRTENDFVDGRAGTWGLLGSPLFHWSLVALMLVIGLGRLSRAEGLIGVPIGYPRAEIAENYGRLDVGPLFSGHTGLNIAVSDFMVNYVDDGGQERGPSPVVTLSDGDRVVARQRVYPNAPLRRGAMLVHMSEYGYAPVIEFVNKRGVRSQVEPLVDRPSEHATQSEPFAFEIPAEDGSPLRVQARLVPPQGGAKDVNDLTVVVRLGENGELGEKTLLVGQSFETPGGVMTLKEVTHYMRLSVADDWSVYPMYALFFLAVLGLVLSLLVPFRTASALLVTEDSGAVLNVTWRHRRADPLFAEKVQAAVHEAAASADGPPL